jgi:mono/diheme cytochrome c family protein
MSSRCSAPAGSGRQPALRQGHARSCCLVLLCFFAACEREDRNFASLDASASARSSGTDGSAYAIAQGKQLYLEFNCVGCHGMGGGGMGPPLMDREWRYGSNPESVFQSITNGRPGGMPAFGERIVEPQRWWLAAYVRSMSGLVPKDRRPGRADALQAKAPELIRDQVEPRTVPPGRPGTEGDTADRIRPGPAAGNPGPVRP